MGESTENHAAKIMVMFDYRCTQNSCNVGLYILFFKNIFINALTQSIKIKKLQYCYGLVSVELINSLGLLYNLRTRKKKQDISLDDPVF